MKDVHLASDDARVLVIEGATRCSVEKEIHPFKHHSNISIDQVLFIGDLIEAKSETMLEEEKNAIELLRWKVLAQIQEINKDGREIHPKDVNLITDTHDMLWRFILFDLDCNEKVKDEVDLTMVNYDNACKLLLESLKWRKQYGLHDIRDDHFPREFYKLKMFTYTYHKDINRLILFIRVNRYIKSSSAMRELIIRCLVHEVEKKVVAFSPLFDRGFYDLNAITVLDCTGLGYQSLDIQLMMSTLALTARFPLLGRESWIYGLPSFAKYLEPIVRKGLPCHVNKRIFLVSHAEAVARIGLDKLPKFMGGTCPVDPDIEIPEESKDLDHLDSEPSRLIKPCDWLKFKKHFQKLALEDKVDG